MENAIRAGATEIEVIVDERPEENILSIAVEDNGPGLPVDPEVASNPFYTTKEGKKTGLGLSLFRFRVEQAGGEMKLERSALGGLAVRARMKHGHVDRSPLGDLASTIASVACTNPDVELRARLRVGGRELTVSSTEAARGVPFGARNGIAMAQAMKQRIKEGLTALHATE